MKIAITLIFLWLFFSVTLVNASESTITIYYNGTVKAELRDINQFFLIGSNITDLKIIGSEYNISNGVLYINSQNKTVYVSYNSNFPEGVIQVNQKQNYTISVILPTNVSISYMYPQPSIIKAEGGFYNITFKDVSSLTVLYSFYPTTPQSHSIDKDELYLILGLVVNVAVLLASVFLLVRKKNKMGYEKGSEEVVDVVNDVLDERDAIVLEAIKKGANTLADIVRQTGLPKSTAYRRTRKLVKLGYIEEIRDGGKIRYEVKEKREKGELP